MSRKMPGTSKRQQLGIAPTSVPTPGNVNRASKKEVQMCCMLLRFKKPHISNYKAIFQWNWTPKKTAMTTRREFSVQASLPGANLWFALVSLHKIRDEHFPLFFWCNKKTWDIGCQETILQVHKGYQGCWLGLMLVPLLGVTPPVTRKETIVKRLWNGAWNGDENHPKGTWYHLMLIGTE